MRKCAYCGDPYDYETELDDFYADSYLLSLEKFRKNLCASCALKAIEDDREEGLYFETCENCGREFDLIVEEDLYDEGLRAIWDRYNKIVCARCARELEGIICRRI